MGQSLKVLEGEHIRDESEQKKRQQMERRVWIQGLSCLVLAVDALHGQDGESSAQPGVFSPSLSSEFPCVFRTAQSPSNPDHCPELRPGLFFNSNWTLTSEQHRASLP